MNYRLDLKVIMYSTVVFIFSHGQLPRIPMLAVDLRAHLFKVNDCTSENVKKLIKKNAKRVRVKEEFDKFTNLIEYFYRKYPLSLPVQLHFK
jgi:hypothetical protein